MKLITTKTFELAVNERGSEDSQKLALVLPGRLDTKDYACFDTHLELLASKGFYAVCFDPPGTWESSGAPDLFTTTNYIKAVDELIEYFGDKPTFLVGHSRGGQVAMLAGAMNLKVKGFASINGSLGAPTLPKKKDIEGRYLAEYRDFPPGTTKTGEKKRLYISTDYWEDGKNYDAGSLLLKSIKPKLFLYGLRDEYTSPEEIEEIFKQIPEPKKLFWLDSSHDYRYYPKVIEEINGYLDKFLDEYPLLS